jgi:hypothetical protein
MSFNYQLKSHQDIGYSNFFDTFRKEYDDMYYNIYDKGVLYDFIDLKLAPFKAKTGRDTALGTLIFDTEAHFHWFLLRWQNKQQSF